MSQETLGIHGTEFLFSYPLTDRLLLQTNYTYTQHEEGEGLRIPKHKVNASFHQQFNSNTQLLTSIQFVGDRDDLAGQDLVVLSSYWLLDFRISHQLSQEGVSLFGSIENVFDADYEEVTWLHYSRAKSFIWCILRILAGVSVCIMASCSGGIFSNRGRIEKVDFFPILVQERP